MQYSQYTILTFTKDVALVICQLQEEALANVANGYSDEFTFGELHFVPVLLLFEVKRRAPPRLEWQIEKYG
ncbi:hypothetical protein FAZ19_04525 [Sphingobacterium alkalisoli]|uniref:Uncharacterized protein n=1 Tax=Sphingobacterium alkalisoli TaxID=1874115 RepID=A0A4U0H9F5_9SPHI|nr:hypothetical protein [Sphingobacterium alkalisoli]TJY68525.1 hypothetical protein FAZ19_04525 [Sphingobacterium alkalisoli]